MLASSVQFWLREGQEDGVEGPMQNGAAVLSLLESCLGDRKHMDVHVPIGLDNHRSFAPIPPLGTLTKCMQSTSPSSLSHSGRLPVHVPGLPALYTVPLSGSAWLKLPLRGHCCSRLLSCVVVSGFVLFALLQALTQKYECFK